MNLSKSREFFDPSKVQDCIHIVGCGSVGSTIVENLARCGITKMCLWDFDDVEPHNIHNQMFTDDQIGENKAEALKELVLRINPEAEPDIEVKTDGWNGELLSGYVFLCVDNIELRKKIVDTHMYSAFVKAMFDVRTGLTNAQHYATDWSNYKTKKNFVASMNFTHEEAKESTPVSACGVTLGVVTTVRIICAYAVNNFMKFINGEELWNFLQFDGFEGFLDTI